jgi:hypothetical protein
MLEIRTSVEDIQEHVLRTQPRSCPGPFALSSAALVTAHDACMTPYNRLSTYAFLVQLLGDLWLRASTMVEYLQGPLNHPFTTEP